MSPYVCDCTNVVYMFCVYCIYNYVNKFEARSLFSTSHLFAKNRKLHKFTTTNSNFQKSTLSDIHTNFQQNRISRSVKTVHTNLFAKKSQVVKICKCQ